MEGEVKVTFVGDLQKVQLKPGDVLVLKLKGRVPMSVYQNIQEGFKRVFPDNKLIILEDGAELGVIER